MISEFLPKTRTELETYLKLSQKIDQIKDQQKLVDMGIWATGTEEGFNIRLGQLERLKYEYMDILKSNV